MNPHLIEFGFLSLRRRFRQRFSVWLVFVLLIFITHSVLLITNSLKHELFNQLDALPELTLQRIVGGRQTQLPTDLAWEIAIIPGVERVYPRVWGYYYFQAAGVNFTVVGIDPDLDVYHTAFNSTLLESTGSTDSLKDRYMVVGPGVKRILSTYGYGNSFTFYTHRGESISLPITSVFNTVSALETNDIMMIPEHIARTLFHVAPERATDILIEIPNPEEIETIKAKIQFDHPELRVVSTNDLKGAYTDSYNYKSGIFLLLLSLVLMAFLILVYDKTSATDQGELREIGIQKALGWSTGQILSAKLIEHEYLAVTALLTGSILSYAFVYVLDAPLLLNVFLGAAQFRPPIQLVPQFHLYAFLLTAFLFIPLYTFAILFPVWRVATGDPDEVMR